MKPNANKISIDNNEERIISFIKEVIINPKHTLKKWSEITRQTPSFKLGYIGQHLASLITGIQGSGSGARGDDLSDGTEVKSCNKIDQVDKCKDCGARVLRYEEICPFCNSDKIDRKDDSKWLFSIRSESELKQYKELDRILLILIDYPKFKDNYFEDIRISAFEIYPKDPRCNVFNQLIDNHYYNIYLPKISSKGKANPMNLHPFSYQFYKCNPTLIFKCIIKEIENDEKCEIIIEEYIKPFAKRKGSILMPSVLLKAKEWDFLDYKKVKDKYNLTYKKDEFKKLTRKQKEELIPYLDEELREKLPLREIISSVQHSTYKRN